MKNSVPDDKIISRYGKVFRKADINTIVDLNNSMNIDFDFQIHSINKLVNVFNGIMPPNRISHYVLAFIKSGSGKKTIGNHTFNIQPNMALIFPKKVIHSTNRWSLDTSGYMLSFSETLFEKVHFPASFLKLRQLFKFSVIPYRVFNLELSEKLDSLFQQLLQYRNPDNEYDEKIFILRLSELLLLYQKEFIKNSVTENEINILFDKFVELLESDFRTNKEVKYYANELSIHANHLNKIVQSCAFVSVKEYIKQRVFLESKYLLSATNIPIKEIAYDLGFSDYNYFCRQFKKTVGNTPMQYRNKIY